MAFETLCALLRYLELLAGDDDHFRNWFLLNSDILKDKTVKSGMKKIQKCGKLRLDVAQFSRKNFQQVGLV
jgi:DNA-binding SARP family transcriptional activator